MQENVVIFWKIPAKHSKQLKILFDSNPDGTTPY